ncbi:MAG: endonuclease [Alteromonadaceae bacterium]|nr:endonuclease [Alteromonadaceae bacterium]
MKIPIIPNSNFRVECALACVFYFLNISVANATIPQNYYDTVNTATAASLKSSLHEIIDDHQRFPYTSSATDTWDILETADQDPDNTSNIIDVYKNTSYQKEGGGNSFYNREHTWPKSYGFPNDGSSNYPYTDTHHLFLSDSSYNSSRSNKPFANCDSGCSEKTTLINNNRGGGVNDSNWTGGSYADGSWETWQGRKGDVARALMYMAVRYEGGTHAITGASEPDLILTDDRTLIDNSSTGSNGSVAYMGLKSVLIQWHKDDPVDAFEFQHNETVYSFQGNRNPFVDHPEYVACVFENVCSGGGSDTTPPDLPVNVSAVGGDGLVELYWTANVESDLAGYHVYRSDTSGGSFVRINSTMVNTSAYTDSNVMANTTYFYVITAIDTSNNESASSTETFATTNDVVIVSGDVAWINELHYDNSSTDVGEFVEIAGSAGTDLNGWSIVAYNGNGGSVYKTTNLSGVLSDQENEFGTLFFNISGLQNGAPDGLALVDNSGTVIQFISYEGSFTAANGAASGMTSENIGVSETSSTPAGYSLQLSGTGQSYNSFTWQAAAVDTSGALNHNQSFGTGAPVNQAPIASLSESCNSLSCTFDASGSSDSDGSITNYDWTFGDGGSATGVNPTYSYSTDGSYTVTLTVTDNDGATSTTSETVTVVNVISEPWVNEVHYDNSGSDKDEFIEIAGVAGINLAGWKIEAYNGNGGTLYKTINLSGVISNQQNGFGTISFEATGLQNGGPDGFALIDDTGSVVQFLSYEGTFTATAGSASGMTSTNIGVWETSSTPSGYSLQLTGNGQSYDDFTWSSPTSDTMDSINNGQSF